MLGLPSSTEGELLIPKEALYKNANMSAAVKESFVQDIEAITLVNSIKIKTVNIPEGENVHEIQVIKIDLKGSNVPAAAVDVIDGANPHKKLFVCMFDGEGCLAVKMSKLVVGPWMPEEQLKLEMGSPESLDTLWDTLASQVVYGDTGSACYTVEERYERDQKIETLCKEISKVDAKCRKEKQPGKKNELFAKVKKLKTELAELEKGM